MEYDEMISKFCFLSNLSKVELSNKLEQYKCSNFTIYQFFIWRCEFPIKEIDDAIYGIGIEAYKYLFGKYKSGNFIEFDLETCKSIKKMKNDYFHSQEYSNMVVKWMKK